MNSEPWFVPRSVGIGWRPATWQGWLVTAVAMVGIVSLLIVFRLGKSPFGIIAVVGVLAVYFLIAATTSRLGVRADAAAGSASVADTAAQVADGGSNGATSSRGAPTTVAGVHAAPIIARSTTPAASSVRPEHPPALVVDGLTKRFRERVAFQDVSFTVGAGEVFGFLGPNGAGKTTTVRTLGTLISPSAGSATVAGIPLLPRNGEAIRQRISVMPEAPGLYQRLSVRENLEFFAGLFSVAGAPARIHGALEAVNLVARADDLCGSLSKGLRQRVALARALLNDPDILFLDEPTSGLDPVATRDVHTLIDGLRRRGVTIFLTTHRLEEAERLCDRVAILNTTLRMVGRPDELRARLFRRSLLVVVASPLPDGGAVFGTVTGVERWSVDDAGRYVLAVSDPKAIAPAVTRALVAAGADVVSISELQHSLEDVYLQLISDDVEANAR